MLLAGCFAAYGEENDMIIRNAKVYSENGTFEIRDIGIENDQFVTPYLNPSFSGDEEIDATGLYAIPGLTDLHFHGCVGRDFCEGTEDAVTAIAEYEGKNGITTICPATMTFSEEILSKICTTAGSYQNGNGADLVGINMEGPFLSVAKKGAQNEKYIHKPDVEMFRRLQKQAGGLIRIVDIAPEVDGAMDFIDELKGEVVISLAHSAANYTIATEAFGRGASHVTHLYNAMTPFTHREPGLVGAACDVDEVRVELICDGIHIHPAVVRATLKMFGEDRVIMISDSLVATGMPDGQYELGGQAITVSGKYATVTSTDTLAGSVSNLMDCMKNAVKNMGIPLETAVRCAAVNPAKQIGIYDRVGSISVGKTANLVLLDKDLNTKTVVLKGKLIF